MKLENNWLQKSLQSLEKKDWGTPEDSDSYLVRTVSSLRKVPLQQYSVEDVRIMIGQNEGLDYLVRVAVEILRNDLFAEGDYYPGDLLKNVLNIKPSFWMRNQDLWRDINELIKNRLDELTAHKIPIDKFYKVVT